MLKRYTFWLWTAAVIQILTALVHSLSFFNKAVPNNETERQLLDLLDTYKFDFGAGFHHTLADFFNSLSASFGLLFLFGGMVNIFLLRKKTTQEIMKGITGINVLIYGACFLITFVFTFLPPIIMTGLVFLTLCLAYATNHIHFIVLKED